jgi:hypothetical protein
VSIADVIQGELSSQENLPVCPRCRQSRLSFKVRKHAVLRVRCLICGFTGEEGAFPSTRRPAE